jgi:hypothetical protein
VTSANRSETAAPDPSSSSFARVLHAVGPHPELANKLKLYAWLVGHWDFDVCTFTDDGLSHAGRGEIHAGWVLQGRAIQDVWMIPRLTDRRPGVTQIPGAGNWYGTTLRIFDPHLDAWHILWNDPATGFSSRQVGRARGPDIVQEGPDPRGGKMRWTFNEIGTNSFHWLAEHSVDSFHWRKIVDIHARRNR